MWVRAVIVWLLLLTAADLLQANLFAADGNRVALVIGNSKYVHAPTLSNPVSDARLMAETLRRVGFKVIEGIDLDYAGMHDRLNRFTEASYDSELAVIYYAGHGMQVNGKNYLVPVDAELTSPAHLRTRTIQIDDLLAALPPDPGVGVVILDACRDNPMARTLATSLPKSRSTAGSGLAPIDASSADVGSGGVLIAYATDPGAVSYDGSGANSPYTTSLAKHLAEPGVDIQNALTRVRGEVTAATEGRQRPWYNASLGREVFIGPATAETETAPGQAEGGNSANQAAEPNSREWVEQRVWDEASKRNTVAHYEAYLKQFPNGAFAELARLNLDQLKKAPVVAEVKKDASSSGILAESSTATADRENEAGTELTESAIGLDRQKKVDLQERLMAIGYDLDVADGTFGASTRRAIGLWQKENDLPPTTFFTRKQYVRLKLDSDDDVKRYRAQRASEAEKQESATSQKTLKPAPVIRPEPRRRQQARAVKPQPAAKPKADSQAPVTRQSKFRTCSNFFGSFSVPASQKCPTSGNNSGN